MLKQQIPDKPTVVTVEWLLSIRQIMQLRFSISSYRDDTETPFLRLIYKLGQNELSMYCAVIKVLSEIYVPRCGNPFPRCNVKNSAFAALTAAVSAAVIPTLHRALYACATPARRAFLISMRMQRLSKY